MRAYPQITQPQLRYFQKLSQKKYRQIEKKFFAEGVHLVLEALDSDWVILQLLVSSSFFAKKESRKILEIARKRSIPIVETSEHAMQKLSDAVTAQGIIGIIEMKQQNPDAILKGVKKQPVLVMLEDIADPGNVGTIIRTGDWFGVDAVLLNQRCVELFNPKVVRATMGSLFHLPVCTEIDAPSFLQDARKRGCNIMITSLKGGVLVKRPNGNETTIIVLGNEARGVSPEIKRLATTVVTIPKYGQAESLNVAIACGIILGIFTSRTA